MEILITDLIKEGSYSNYNNSIANTGNNNIGQITWENALNSDIDLIMRDKEIKQALIEWFKEFGAWDNLEQWSYNDLNALLIQMICGDLQESNFDRIFQSNNDWYYYIGN